VYIYWDPSKITLKIIFYFHVDINLASLTLKFFSTNSENHNIDTRQKNNLYLPQANLTTYQQGASYLGIKFFNNLPLEIKNAAGNQKKLKISLKKIV
jgi:hypothetical protein